MAIHVLNVGLGLGLGGSRWVSVQAYVFMFAGSSQPSSSSSEWDVLVWIRGLLGEAQAQSFSRGAPDLVLSANTKPKL